MSDIDGLSAYVAFAEMLCDTARPIARRWFRTPVAVDAKSDHSPVTVADREIEQRLRQLIGETYPAHGILGEEEGAERIDARHVWVIDPIDGTRSFVTGKPTFGTLVALLEEGRPILGVIDVGMLDDRWVGARGRPSTHNGRVCHTRTCSRLADAWFYATSPHMFAPGPEATAHRRTVEAVKSPLYGADCFHYGILASGFIDLVVEADLKPYDYLAAVCVLEGAGGRITDWSGAPLGLDSDGRVLAVGDPSLWPAAQALLNG